jgi:hypothetical protein
MYTLVNCITTTKILIKKFYMTKYNNSSCVERQVDERSLIKVIYIGPIYKV